MILIVTPNPLLELRFTVHAISAGTVHRNVPTEFFLGGKGFNVSRQLKFLGVKSMNCTFLGGHSGKIFKDTAAAEGLEVVSAKTEAGTRIASVSIETGPRKVTSLFSPNAEITFREAEEMLVRLEKMITNCEMVLFAGSSPSPAAEAVFIKGLQIAREHDKISVLDTYGPHVEKCLRCAPTIFHANAREVAESLRMPGTGDKTVDTLRHLYDCGVRQAFLTNGEEPFYASNHDFHYVVTPPHIDCFDPTGSGDAFVAGILHGWHRDEVFENTVRFAAALGAKNAASADVCRVSRQQAEALAAEVLISPVGKRMKTIDVSPLS